MKNLIARNRNHTAAVRAALSAFVLTCVDPPACLTTEQGQDSGTITVR